MDGKGNHYPLFLKDTRILKVYIERKKEIAGTLEESHDTFDTPLKVYSHLVLKDSIVVSSNAMLVICSGKNKKNLHQKKKKKHNLC